MVKRVKKRQNLKLPQNGFPALRWTIIILYSSSTRLHKLTSSSVLKRAFRNCEGDNIVVKVRKVTKFQRVLLRLSRSLIEY